MNRQTPKFLIGLFVTMGILIGAGTIVWLGASRYLQAGSRYVTYFDESVQGLSVDSKVKYRGVDVGRVEEIRVAADNNLIEVVMKIDLRGEIEKNTVAQLRTVGITGMVFIELNRREPGETDLSPRIQFAAEHPIIASQPSGIRQMFSKVDQVVGKFMELDLKGLSVEIERTVENLRDLTEDKRLETILTNLESATAHLDATMSVFEKIADRGIVEKTLQEAHDTLSKARMLMQSMQTEITDMKLAETTGSAQHMLETLDRTVKKSATDIDLISENLKRATESLERLLQRLSANPSDIIFGTPPEELGKEDRHD
jgi:phospholipid/cholesterol/gamma-HCH transport system substrate-binding protein